MKKITKKRIDEIWDLLEPYEYWEIYVAFLMFLSGTDGLKNIKKAIDKFFK